MGKPAFLIVLAIICTALVKADKCSKIYKPVCGSNWVTYTNQCYLQSAMKKHDNLKLLKHGECQNVQKEDEICKCSRIYAPVCGSDKVTYKNECEFKCKVRKTTDFYLKIDYQGECKKEVPCICSRMYEPVCGSDGLTYGNKCELQCKARIIPSLKIAQEHECPQKRNERNNKLCRCPFIYTPVCGSNKITYSNKCNFECAKKNNKDFELKIVRQGKCL